MAKTDPTAPLFADLDAVMQLALRHGAKHFGSAVFTIRVDTDDGESRSYGLPSPREAGLSPTKRRILAALRDSPVAVTRKVLGGLIRRKVSGGQVIQDINELVADGAVLLEGDLLADDARKFPRGG